MFKFLRKYSSWILVIGGSLLMITFLAPQAITGLAQYSASTGSTWANVGPNGDKVSVGEFDLLQRQTRLINELQGNPLNQLGVGSSPAHWYLMLREAREAGLIPGPSSGRAIAEGIAQSIGDGVTGDSVILNLGRKAGLSPQQTIQTLSEIAGTTELIRMVMGAGRISDVRLRAEAARKSLGVSADVVIIDARTDATIQAPAPSDEKLGEQLSEFGNNVPGSGEQGFGYLIPDRFKLEWLEIPNSAIEAAVEKSDALDPVALRKAFIRDPNKYGAGTSASASPSFEQFRARVRSSVLKDEVDKMRDDISKFASDQLQFPRRGFSNNGIHLNLPEDWAERKISFNQLATDIEKEFGIPLPSYTSTGSEWLEGTDLGATGDYAALSRARTDRFGRTPMGVQQVVEAMQEFGGNDTVPVQAQVSFPPMETITGDIFIVRATEAEAAREPNDLDEVREQVTKDLEGLYRFDVLEERLPELLAQARTDGLRSVANDFDVAVDFSPDIREVNLQILIQYGANISGSIPGVDSSKDAIADIIEQAMKLDPTTAIAEQPIDKRLFAVTLPDELKILLVKVDKVAPLSQEQWETLLGGDGRFQQTIAQDLAPTNANELFTLESMTDRHQFVLSRDDDDEEELEETTEEPAA